MRPLLREPAITPKPSVSGTQNHCSGTGTGDAAGNLLEKTIVTEPLLCSGGHCWKQIAALAACAYCIRADNPQIILVPTIPESWYLTLG